MKGCFAGIVAHATVVADEGDLGMSKVWFDEIEHAGQATKYVPRSVQVDLEEGVCNRVSKSCYLHYYYNILPYHHTLRFVAARLDHCSAQIRSSLVHQALETTGPK